MKSGFTILNLHEYNVLGLNPVRLSFGQRRGLWDWPACLPVDNESRTDVHVDIQGCMRARAWTAHALHGTKVCQQSTHARY